MGIIKKIDTLHRKLENYKALETPKKYIFDREDVTLMYEIIEIFKRNT